MDEGGFTDHVVMWFPAAEADGNNRRLYQVWYKNRQPPEVRIGEGHVDPHVSIVSVR